MNSLQAIIIGTALIKSLGLKKNKDGTYNTPMGKKSTIGLGMLMYNIFNDHGYTISTEDKV